MICVSILWEHIHSKTEKKDLRIFYSLTEKGVPSYCSYGELKAKMEKSGLQLTHLMIFESGARILIDKNSDKI